MEGFLEEVGWQVGLLGQEDVCRQETASLE